MTRAVLVGAALWLRRLFKSFTRDIRTSSGAWATLANWLMIVPPARGCLGARLRVANLSAYAIESVTGLIIGAVLVVLALASNAGYQGIALVAGFTDTIGAMVLSETFGTLATL